VKAAILCSCRAARNTSSPISRISCSAPSAPLTPIARYQAASAIALFSPSVHARGNLLVLDEPTNDLDVETLESLEDRLAEYDGTLIVVSHDRYFLDAIVTATLVFESDGQVRRHAGGL